MKIEGHAIALVTGANRGIGKAIVEKLIEHGATKVYAAARDTSTLQDLKKQSAGKVIPVKLDLHDGKSIEALISTVSDINLLINNAGSLEFGSQLTASSESTIKDMETNYFGTIRVLKALVPVIEKNGGGSIANVLSIVALAPMPGIGGYSASKAAAHSLTQTLRAELAAKKITVHGIYPGPVDTDMAKDFPMNKTSPAHVANEILKGIQAGEINILPDPVSAEAFKLWKVDQAAVEAQFAAM